MLNEQTVELLPIAKVFPNPEQPRKIFEPKSLEELAASIEKNGLMQPITVVPRRDDTYLIVMGERRWRASKLADKKEIPAIVRKDLKKKTVKELALVENLLRKDLGVVEEARAYQDFLDRGYTIEKLAEVLGFQQSWRIQERLNVLKLAPALLEGLEKEAITPSQAQEMSRLSHEGQFTLWRAIQDGQCPNYNALRRMAAALLDRENQVELFKTELTPEDKAALSKVDRFMLQVGKLTTALGDDDLAALNNVPKSNARACADQLAILEQQCRDLRNVLLSNAAKQELLK